MSLNSLNQSCQRAEDVKPDSNLIFQARTRILIISLSKAEQKHLFTSHNTAHKKGHITKVFTYIETVCVMKG